MKLEDIEKEVNHIFESGANEIRIINLIKNISFPLSQKKEYELKFLTNLNPFKKDDILKCEPLQYGFSGGFEGDCHGGQWTTEGGMYPTVIVKILKTEKSAELNYVGHVLVFELSDIDLVDLSCR